MSRLVVGPFPRVEGDLEVQLELEDGRVAAARVRPGLYRGFEQLLQGKDPLDALVYAPRICGICSVSQSVAAAYALADLQGITMPPNGELATNLILACENAADHLTHFYLFFMPDFARPAYAGEPWFEAVARRFTAMTGEAVAQAMAARKDFLHLMGIMAGKWPHTLTIQPGGSARAVESGERLRLLAILAQFRGFLERHLFGAPLERIVALDSPEALRAWAAEAPTASSDFRLFLQVADGLALQTLGRATDRFMSYGSYPVEGKRLFEAGVWEDGPQALDIAEITEDVSHAWLAGTAEPLHPAQGVTLPDMERVGAYSWCKAPRLAGRVVEVGALARQLVAGHPLVRGLVAESGGNVRNRVVARLLELARIVIAMEDWVKALRLGQPFCSHGKLTEEGQGTGLVEAARGSLGHWLAVRNGRIANYQVIAPTTWNFSPRDADGTPGPLEQALVGAPVRTGETEPLAVQHIVRSFDPCMVCTVH